jgi:Double-GTPase 2
MSGIDLISYRAQERGDGMIISQTATTIVDQQETSRWLRRLEPRLRMGDPQGSAYLDFGSQAAFIRWQADARSRIAWDRAVVLVGSSAQLTGTYALEFPELAGSWPSAGGTGIPPADGTPGPRRAAIEARARAADAVTSITVVLAHALQGARRVTMPQSEPARNEAVLWGAITILRMIGDTRPVSFLTYASVIGRDEDMPGLLVSFRPAAVALPPDQGFAKLATDLAGRFANDPARLRQVLAEHSVPEATDDNARINRLLTLPPSIQPGNFYRRGTTTVTADFGEQAARVEAAMPAIPVVMCPICLGDIPNWGALDYWRWDATIGDGDYVRIDIPPDLNPSQRARFTHGAYVRCTASTDVATVAHYLPARYGSFGDPVLLGFVGLTQSGKTHLLASMIGEIDRLSEYGVDVAPLDRATHHDFLESSVKPLITGHRVLPGTPDDASTTLTDALIVRQRNGLERVVALFDVSGGDLVRRDSTKEFLWIADGLFFVIDPDHIRDSKAGDDAFSNVLDIMGARPKAEPACAAIVLNKADKARFEEPIARWLRAGDGTLDPTEFLRESADVYAYLEQHHAAVLTKPYQACRKATLHVASPTGGAQEGMDKISRYPRGVTPLRVLRPLVAMLAMTGVLTGPQAEQVGL